MINPWRLGAIVSLAVSATFLISSGGWLAEGAPSGEYPGWLEATSTALGLLAAAIAAVYAAAAFHREGARDDRRADFEARAQADEISIWADAPRKVLARNGSPSPVYDVTVQVQIKPGGTTLLVHHDGVMPPTTEPRKLTLPADVLAAWEANQWDYEGWIVTFTDTAGVRWNRDIHGRLTKVHDAPPL